MTIEQWTSLLGWCSLLNLSLLAISALLLMLFERPVKAIHQRMFGLDDRQLTLSYFSYLANYKILVLVFNLMPYIALNLMQG